MTAPLHQAPDAEERIVAALAESLGTVRVEQARQADWWTSDEDHALLIRVLRAECEPWAEALAPTVARLIEDARREDRERLAGVEALARRAISAVGTGGHSHWRSGGAGGHCSACAEQGRVRAELELDLRAALHPKETDR